MAFVATISGVTYTFVYRESNATSNDVLVELQNVSATSLTMSGTSSAANAALNVNGTITPAGIAGDPINLALSDPSGQD